MMINRRLPDWLYNLLPFLYTGVGLLTVIVLQNEMAIFSGLTLVSAGALIGYQRYQRPRTYNQGTAIINDPEMFFEEAPVTGLVQISWRKSFESGHPVIDAQHRLLFSLGNELINADLMRRPQPDVELLIDDLINHITNHFRTEEAVLANTKHPVSSEHQAIHSALLAKATNIRERFHSGQIVSHELIGFVVCDLITDHITKADLKFAGEVK